MAEEQEAIEYFKTLKEYLGQYKQEWIEKGTYKFYETFEINLETILNIIKERNKRIKELEEENVILRKANNITRDLIKEVKIEDITQVINKSYEEFVNQFIPKQKVTDKLKEYLKAIKRDGIYGYDKEINEILNIIEGEKK